MADSYCSTDDIALWLGTTLTSDDEDVIDTCITAASRWIDSYTARRFWTDTADVVRYYVPSSSYYIVVDDLVSVTTLKTDSSGDGTYESTWATTDFQLWPLNATEYPEQRPYDRIEAVGSLTFPHACSWGRRRDLVQITGKFGWPAVPSAIRQACTMWATSLFKRRGSPQGSINADEFGPIPLIGDRDIERLLDPYRGPRAFGIA